MLKTVIAIALLISLSFFVNEGRRSMSSGEHEAERPVKVKGGYPLSGQEKPEFYPEVPASLPDLRDGYLFNEERMLSAAEEEGGEEEDAGGEHEEIKVNMDDVMYVGSVIRGDVRKGLVAYPAQRKSPKTLDKIKRTKKKTLWTSRNQDYARLLVGESFSDYKVVEIEPDRIEFEKGGKRVVKLLNDPGKERIKPPPGAAKKRSTGIKKAAARTQSKKADTARRQRVKIKTAAPTTRHGDKLVIPPPLPEHDDLFN